jgi:hypothetical protein
MDRVRKAMKAQGLDWANTSTFYGGHSLGGAMMPDYVLTVDDAKGQVLMGSFLTRKFKTEATPEGRPQYAFPVPTLTIGGELDGLCRLTRIAEALYTQVTFSGDPVAAAQALPVTVIAGMNHYEFASGSSPPAFVAANDLRAEISEEQAHALVAADTVAFLAPLLGVGDWSALAARSAASAAFVQPVVDAFLMEGYAEYLPPCLCEEPDEYFYYATNSTPPPPSPFDAAASNPRGAAGEAAVGGDDKLPFREFGTCFSQPHCAGGSPWTGQVAMPTMAGASNGYYGPAEGGLEGLTVKAVDSLHIVTEEKPSCHLPHIHGGGANRPNFANPGSVGADNKYNPPTAPLCVAPTGCQLNVTTVTQHVYENSGEFDLWRLEFHVDSLDTGFAPLAAFELRSKLKSREAAFDASGFGTSGQGNYSVDSTDTPVAAGGTGGDRCGEVNQAAIDWAFASLPQAAQDRYRTYGQKLVVGPDKTTCAGGPCWIWDRLRFEKDDDANSVTVSSVVMVEPNFNKFPCGEAHADADGVKQFIPCPTGFHYCKLLSPARALEWMLVDGLKLNYKGYPNTTAH